MSDSSKLSDTGKLINEAVVKPLADEFGKVGETVVQSVQGYPNTQTNSQNTQAALEKKQKEKKRIREITEFYKRMQQEQVRVQQEDTRQKMQKQAEEKQVEDKTKVKQIELVQKDNSMPDLLSKQRMIEIKKGGG